MEIVIIGNGIAGNQAAFQLRAKSKTDEICILSAEAVPEYDPCSLPYFLSGEVKKENVFRKSITDYAEQDIELRLNFKASAINPESKCVSAENGLTIRYDKLVLAHGGSLFIPPVEGIDKEGVFSCKQLSETEKLASCQGSRAVVIGSGAIGMEAAEALAKKGYQTTIVELFDWILPTMFDPETAGRLESALLKYGVQVFTSEKVMAVQGRDMVEAIVTDKRTIPCDTVVIATGVVPGVALAETAGIEVGRGIKVNQYMQTNRRDIYACGDCVETVDLCTGEDAMFQLKHNALDQAAVVAENILGGWAEYPGAYAFARVHFWKTHAASFGKTTRSTQCQLGELEIVEKEDEGGYLRLILKDDLIVGGQAVGKFADNIGLFMYAMHRKENFARLRNNWPSVCNPKQHYLWPRRLMGKTIGMT